MQKMQKKKKKPVVCNFLHQCLLKIDNRPMWMDDDDNRIIQVGY